MRRKNSKKTGKDGISYWQSYSDMMAALILVFVLIIAITMVRGMREAEVMESRAEEASSAAELASAEAASAAEEASLALIKASQEAEEASKALAEADKAKGQLEEVVGVRKEIIRRLFAEFSQDGEVSIDPDTGDLVLQSEILFDTDEYELKSEGNAFLKDFFPRYIKIMMNPDIKEHISDIVIEGHTDPNGTYEHNIDLSLNRARSVAEFCISEKDGVLQEKEIKYLKTVLSTNGKSFSELKYDNKGMVDNDKSRRVEIKFRLADEGQIEKIIEMLDEQKGEPEV